MVMVTQTKSTDLHIPDANVPVEQQVSSHSEFDQLIVTDRCWNRILALANKKQQSLEDVYLRVFVDAGGCSGFTYQFELDSEPIEEDEDVVFQGPQHARVVIDQSSLELLQGSTIDYVQEMIKSSFEVRDNPQSESACGCGSSFALKNFAANPAMD